MRSSLDKSFLQPTEPSSGILSRRLRARVLKQASSLTCQPGELQLSKQWNSDPFGFGDSEGYFCDAVNQE
jgi:hypothetical protein